jgi:hypothetical protein
LRLAATGNELSRTLSFSSPPKPCKRVGRMTNQFIEVRPPRGMPFAPPWSYN